MDGEPPDGRSFGPQKTLRCTPPDPQLTFHWDIAVLSHFQLCPSLCDAVGCTPPGSSVHGIVQARILAWAAMPFSGELPDPGSEAVPLTAPALAGSFLAAGDPEKHLLTVLSH